MRTWETLIVSLISGGLAGVIVRYLLDTRKSRHEYTMRLHEEWWTPQFVEMRSSVYTLAENFKRPTGPGETSKEFLASVEAGTFLSHPVGPAFVRIAFFADLNACLDKRLVDRDLAYRLFGEAQFLWFEPLLAAVAKHIGQKPGVRWVWEIESLGRTFDAIRSRDQRRRA